MMIIQQKQMIIIQTFAIMKKYDPLDERFKNAIIPIWARFIEFFIPFISQEEVR